LNVTRYAVAAGAAVLVVAEAVFLVAAVAAAVVAEEVELGVVVGSANDLRLSLADREGALRPVDRNSVKMLGHCL
jgi:hypothetical protein